LLPREIAVAERSSAAAFVARTNGLRLLLVLACLCALFAASTLHLIAADVAVYSYLLLPTCAVAIISTNAVSERVVSRDVHAISIAVVGGMVFFVASAVPLLKFFGGNGYALVVAYLFGKSAEAAILVRGRLWLVRTAFAGARRVLIAMWPFSVQALVAIIYSRLPIFLIERMGTSRQEVGLVSAGLALRNVLLLVTSAMALLSYPALSVAARDRNVSQMRQIVATYLIVCGASVVAGVGLLVLFIGRLSAVLHIPPARQGFTIWFVAAGITTVGTALGGVALQAFGGEQIAARLSVVAFLLAVAYYAAAIWFWGVWGTVWGLIGSEITILALIGRAAWLLRSSRFQDRSFAPIDGVTGM
jgi:O-antigen/teichoic acid export membrane protein